jgi:hypothetical protein
VDYLNVDSFVIDGPIPRMELVTMFRLHRRECFTQDLVMQCQILINDRRSRVEDNSAQGGVSMLRLNVGFILATPGRPG